MGKTKKQKAAAGTAGRTAAHAQISIERWRVGDFQPAEYNPRKKLQPGDAEFVKIERSIDQFGYVDPLIVNKRSRRLVGGHQRLAVLRHRGLTDDDTIDVSVVDLDDVAERQLNVALNKATGAWDDVLLAELLVGLKQAGADTTLTGFSEAEMQAVLDQALLATKPAAEEAEAVSGRQIGDSFAVLVQCKSEQDQRQVYEAMKARGYSCRVLTV